MFISVAQWMGLLPSYQPYPFPAGVKDTTQQGAFGVKRDDNAGYTEINITEGARPIPYITDITDKTSNRDGDFPLGANN